MQIAETPIYICDIDGTLLGSDGALSEFARDGLNKLLSAGMRLTVASSRATPAIRALLAGVNLELPVIEFNGAFVSELASGRHLASSVLSKSAACAAVEAILATGSDPVVSAWDGSRDRVHFGSSMNEGTGWYVEEKRAYDDPRLTACDDLLGAAGQEEVASIVGFVRDTEAAALSESLREAVGGEAVVYCAQNYYCPGWTELQIQHPAAEKGAAVPALLAACGAVGAEVVACGDHLNDLGLFAAAARSIAPSNAHPTVLARATVIVGSSDEDGIVRHLLDCHLECR
ncbi:MAG TPA: HAD family hydrolase [Solirubrobacterales bacterium]|nr:HAD family hydrolase [Solirubrobacterales bacterium]